MHYYDKDGNPHHTVIGKNGKERDTTLRDARKEKWLPSVTGIINVMAAPALENWELRQLGNAMIEEPYEGFEAKEMYFSRMQDTARQSSIRARDEGAKIHKAIEMFYNGDSDWDQTHKPHVVAVDKLVNKHFESVTWIPEQTFAHELGFGGMCDLYTNGSYTKDDRSCLGNPITPNSHLPIVIDFKTKDFTSDDKPPKIYANQAMQLEACANGLKVPDADIYNIFISRTEPGLAHLQQSDKGDYWSMFKHLLAVWKINNNYYCGRSNEN